MTKQTNDFEVAVIGAGPAGMMAAITAGGRGLTVALIEKNAGPGLKLLLTGQGRCNLTNSSDITEFPDKYHNGAFLRNGLHRFSNTDLTELFEQNGLPTKQEPDGRVFPRSDKASDVVATLGKMLRINQVQFLPGLPVETAVKKDGVFETAAGGRLFRSGSVILACGGRSYPGTGSTGDGETLAAGFGHTIIPARPALSAVDVEEPFIRHWEGVNLRDIPVTVTAGGRPFAKNRGDIVFTRTGVSGPAILNISGDIAEHAGRGGIVLTINFAPSSTPEQLDELLQLACREHGAMLIRNMLKRFLAAGLIDGFLLRTDIPETRTGGVLTKDERRTLRTNLQQFPLTVSRVKGFDDSMATRGGVSAREINPKTMESKIVPGLFFAGEIIDVDGMTGGYNLQAAFTTGWCAGKAAYGGNP